MLKRVEPATPISDGDEMVTVTIGHPFNVTRQVRRGRHVPVDIKESPKDYHLLFTQVGGLTTQARAKPRS